MKKYTILKGMHLSNFIPTIKWVGRIFNISKVVTFDSSCAYVVGERSCVNKLFGWQFGIFGVHKNSYRFGWTYNREEACIDLYAYTYCDGKLNKKKIGSTLLNTPTNMTIAYDYNSEHGYRTINYQIDGKTLLSHSVNSKEMNIAFTLGFYFGGHSRAPHTMSVTMM